MVSSKVPEQHPALLVAQVTEYMNAGARQFGFLVRGLREVEKTLKELGIPFFLLHGRLTPMTCADKQIRQMTLCTIVQGNLSLVSAITPCEVSGDPVDNIPELVRKLDASVLVTDFIPLRVGRQWREGVRRMGKNRFEDMQHVIARCLTACRSPARCLSPFMRLIPII